MKDVITTDLADFGSIERSMLVDLLIAWRHQGLPEDFYSDEVRPMMNRNSGNVFLTNSEFQVAKMNGDKLESFYICSYCGNEGFADEIQLNDEGCECCHALENDEQN